MSFTPTAPVILNLAGRTSALTGPEPRRGFCPAESVPRVEVTVEGIVGASFDFICIASIAHIHGQRSSLSHVRRVRNIRLSRPHSQAKQTCQKHKNADENCAHCQCSCDSVDSLTLSAKALFTIIR